MIKVVPTKSGEDVTTHNYDLLFSMIGPEGEEEYRFLFRYNKTMRRWVLNVYNTLDRVVVMGAPVLLGVNLLGYAAPGLRPRGFLVAIWKSNTASAREPEERDLGEWCDLVYFERAEDLDDTDPVEPPLV